MAVPDGEVLRHPVVVGTGEGVLQVLVDDIGKEQPGGGDPQADVDPGDIHVFVTHGENVLDGFLVGQRFAAGAVVRIAFRPAHAPTFRFLVQATLDQQPRAPVLVDHDFGRVRLELLVQIFGEGVQRLDRVAVAVDDEILRAELLALLPIGRGDGLVPILRGYRQSGFCHCRLLPAFLFGLAWSAGAHTGADSRGGEPATGFRRACAPALRKPTMSPRLVTGAPRCTLE